MTMAEDVSNRAASAIGMSRLTSASAPRDGAFDERDEEAGGHDRELRARRRDEDREQMREPRPVVAVGGEASVQKAAGQERRQHVGGEESRDRDRLSATTLTTRTTTAITENVKGPRFHKRIASANHAIA